MLDPEFALHDDFPPVGYEAWRALAEADLAGASFEQKLITHTYEGIDLQPVYTRRDHPGEGDPEGFPGRPPPPQRGQQGGGASARTRPAAPSTPTHWRCWLATATCPCRLRRL